MGGQDDGLMDRAMLEAFIQAAPLAYCGFGPNETVIYSPDLLALLDLDDLERIEDIQSCLTPDDAAALESLFSDLRQNRQSFSLQVQTADHKKIFKLIGRCGEALDNNAQHYDVLWVEDISGDQSALKEALADKERAETERDHFQVILDRVPRALWVRDKQARITYCNQAYADIFDATTASIIAEQRELSLKSAGKTSQKIDVHKLAELALETNDVQEVQAHIVMNGARRLFKVYEVPLSHANMTMGVALDITREEELETAQQRYTASYKELLEQIGTGVGIFNVSEKLEFYNSAFARLWHLEDQYLNTQPGLSDLMEKLREIRRLPEQADFRKFKQSWLNMFTGLIDPHEEMLYLPDATALRMMVVPHPMGGLMMMFEDVTSRLELESSYNTLIAVQKETLDNLAEGVSVYGGDGRLKLWNPAFINLWDLQPEDVDGQPHISQIIDKMQNAFGKKEWETQKENLISQALTRNIKEGEFTRKDGSIIAFTTVPLPDGGVLVNHYDVTDKMKVENALREKNVALETAERLKLDFLANVSYQLRTPLNAIMGFSEILDKEFFGPLNERQKEYTSGLNEAGDRLVSLINDILDLSTIEAGRMELSKDKVSIKEILETLHDLTSEWARLEKIETKLDYSKDIGDIETDERRLKQIILNLIRNAIEFTPEGGLITIKAGKSGSMINISVSDTGKGINPDDQERIFEPFQRGSSINEDENTSSAGHGAGLGLSLVKNITELLGGTISIASEVGKGTSVTVSLPAKF